MMSFESDDEFEDFVPEGAGNIVLPYIYEPLRESNSNTSSESEESESSEEEQDGDERMPGPVEEWCSCSNCADMPTAVERICCVDVSAVAARASEEQARCITDHEGFAPNCCNRHVLLTSYYAYIETNGPLNEEDLIHEVYRHIAYRNFTRWIYGILGRHVRRVVPACAVKAIRLAFPSEEYVGFKYPA